MWYAYSCPACGRPISVYDNEPNPDYDVVPKLIAEVKNHYATKHNSSQLSLTDEELDYEIRNKKQTSPEEPTW